MHNPLVHPTHSFLNAKKGSTVQFFKDSVNMSFILQSQCNIKAAADEMAKESQNHNIYT